MMLRNQRKVSGQAILEYMVLIIFIIGGLIVMQKYISQAISGRWQSVGDAFSFGRQYDPDQTTECIYDPVYTGNWYNSACYDESDCAAVCLSIVSEVVNGIECDACISGCLHPLCNEP